MQDQKRLHLFWKGWGMDSELIRPFVSLLVMTGLVAWLAISRQKYREKQKRDTAGAFWAWIHVIVLLIVVVPISLAVFGTLVLSFFEGDWLRFGIGTWVIFLILIIYNYVFETVEEKIKPLTNSFANSIERVRKLESHLMNFLAVAGFYSSVVSRGLDKDVAWEMNYCLLFGAMVVFLDLVVLEIYSTFFLMRGKD